MPAWEATGVLAEPRRAAVRAETPLIGREEEAGLLSSLVDRVEREGSPHLVTVLGQAGVGKSRLLRELMNSLAESDTPPTIRRGQCPPYGAGIAYWALAEVLNDEFDIRDTDAPEAAWEKLRSGVAALMRELGDESSGERNAALLAIPLGLEPPEELKQAEADPQRMREALFSAARAAVEAIARRRTLVLAIDDIHWADEGMLDLIDHLTRWVRAPLLLVCLTRDELLERRPGWGGGRRNATTISLEPLTENETRELVAALMPGSDNGSADVVPQVAERSGGNPLFAEEMVNRLLEEETAEAQALPAPFSPCSLPGSTPSTGSSAACCSPPPSSGRPSGRAHWPPPRPRRASTSARPSQTSRRRTCSSPARAADSPASANTPSSTS